MGASPVRCPPGIGADIAAPIFSASAPYPSLPPLNELSVTY
jgi:hypothetical protein